jgi:hypothetical protein
LFDNYEGVYGILIGFEALVDYLKSMDEFIDPIL